MRFWRDGLGFTELFDHTFTGDWPTLFGAETDQLRSIFLGDPAAPDTGIVELVVLEGVQARAGIIGCAGVRLLPACRCNAMSTPTLADAGTASASTTGCGASRCPHRAARRWPWR